MRAVKGHDRAADGRADDGAYAEEQKQAAGDLHEIFRSRKVIGMGHGDRIERIRGGAVENDERDEV